MALELNTLLVRGFIKIGPRVLRFLFVLSDLSPFLSLLLFFFFSIFFYFTRVIDGKNQAHHFWKLNPFKSMLECKIEAFH